MVEIDRQRPGLLDDKQAEPLDPPQVHAPPPGRGPHPVQVHDQVVPALLQPELLVEAVMELVAVLPVAGVMNAAVEFERFLARVTRAR